MRGTKERGHGPSIRLAPVWTCSLSETAARVAGDRPPGSPLPARPFTWAGRYLAAGRATSPARWTWGDADPVYRGPLPSTPFLPGRRGESLQVTLPQPRAPCCSRAGSPITSDGYRACGTPVLWPVREPAVLTLGLLEETALVTRGVRAPASAGGRGGGTRHPLSPGYWERCGLWAGGLLQAGL